MYNTTLRYTEMHNTAQNDIHCNIRNKYYMEGGYVSVIANCMSVHFSLQFFCSMAATFSLNFFLSGFDNVQWGYFYQPGLINFGEFQVQVASVTS